MFGYADKTFNAGLEKRLFLSKRRESLFSEIT
jgi:hypothetical protein